MNFDDIPLEIIGEIAGESSRVYHPLVLACPRFARSLTLGDRLDFAEKFGHDCRIKRHSIQGVTIWTKNSIAHRTDGPAVEWADGSKLWYVNGELHRVDGPATVWSNGRNSWYLNGKLHRIDGPAIEYADGTREWYINDELHRVDGPAVEFADGDKIWYTNGNRTTEYQFVRLTVP